MDTLYRFLSVLLFLMIGLESNVLSQFQNNNQLQFETITKEEGLLHSFVIHISQDADGYIWLGTYGGLHRFDGTQFNYYQNTSDKSSLSDNNLYVAFHDSKKRMWVGSENGISLFVPETNNFLNFNSADFNFKHVALRAITEDKNGNLWIATYGGGIACFDPEKRKIIQWYNRQNQKTPGDFINEIFTNKNGDVLAGLESKGICILDKKLNKFLPYVSELSEQTVNTIAEDQSGNLWIGTWTNGLYKVNKKDQLIKNFNSQSNKIKALPDNTIRDISIDKNGKLWLATTNGLGYFNPDTEECFLYRNNKQNSASLSFNYLWTVFVDREGAVWIGTFGSGLCKLDPAKNNFAILDSRNTHCPIKHNYVEFLKRDSQGRYWIASDNHGLSIYQSGEHCVFENSIPHSLPDKKYRSFFEDKNHCIWLGTEDGIIRCDKDLKRITHIPLKKGTLGYSIFAIQEDAEGNIWIGGWNMGLFMLPTSIRYLENIKEDQWIAYNTHETNDRYISSDIVWNIFLDSEDNLWIANDFTLSVLNKRTKKFELRKDNIKNITRIIEYPKGTIWISNMGTGLTRIRKNEKPKEYSFLNKEGAISVFDMALIENQLWLGTENGLYALDIPTERVKHFSTIDGLPSNMFAKNSALSLSDGSLLMGTTNGIVHYFSNISDYSFPDPPIRITDIGLFNQSISLEYSKKPLLNKSLSELKETTFKYDQNVISFSYSAIQHSLPQKIQYVYKLEGFQSDWQPSEINRKAFFTNLNSGSYIFKVRSIHEDGSLGNHEGSIKITILPPWWNTFWFRSFSLIGMLSVIVVVFYVRTQSIRKRNKWLSTEVDLRTQELNTANNTLEKQNQDLKVKSEVILDQQKELLSKKYILEKNNEKLSEWNEFQQRLIGIIGHDIRGPLQRFNALLNLLKNNSDKEEALQKLHETAGTLSLLASDLLNWVTLQSSQKEIQLTKFSWKEITNYLVEELGQIANEKNITLSIKHQSHQLVKGVEPIVLAACRNILTNAIRFSDKSEIIEIETGINKDGYSIIRITDFGKGIEDLPAIVERMNGDNLNNNNIPVSLNENMGIGLSLCNYMLKKINGRIEIQSNPGKGSTFLIYLPLEDGLESETNKKNNLRLERNPNTELLKNKTVLLVDDDDEIRWDIARSLEKFVAVYEARTAEEAIKWLHKNTPDLALLDIKMPGLSGIDLCRKIKVSPETAHVPCMIITGDTSESNRKEAFNAGADKFVTKPFTSDEILLQIISYFENQEKQLKRFFSEGISLDELTGNSINQSFLNKLIGLIENNLSSPDLSVEFLAKEIGMSKSSLYRNLKGITGQSANHFIINIRMRKCLALMKDRKLSLADIAIDCGFSNTYYFIRAFKKHFGFSPDEIIK